MPSLFFLRTALRPHWLLTVLFLGLSACESERHPPHGPPPPETGQPPVPATPEMVAHGSFFSGKIEVDANLSRTGFAPKNGEKDPSRGGGRGGPPPGGGMGMGGGRGGRRGGGGGGEGGPRGGKSSEGEDGRVANIRASNEPPVRLHLRLTNHGTESATIEVLDFNSDLGNFVVQPAKLMVPPGASVEAEPMTSRLGIRSAAIPLTVRLRANGQVEKQVLDLKVLSPVEADSSGPATGTAPAPVTPP